ncbi:MAG: PEP-CTERM sorting domain-containing protein [Verrucomicrobia bacterium]|nr:MAG: PEP-CTERM sorting domain-containing protein [Verrucomicrobiota bacterium]
MQLFLGGLTPGVLTFNLQFSATVTNPGYILNNSYVSGRAAVPTPLFGFVGPAQTVGAFGSSIPPVQATQPNTNTLTLSGFSGLAEVNDAGGNLVQNTGDTFASGGTLNWLASGQPAGDWAQADVNWHVKMPTASGNTITYSGNMGQGANGIVTSSFNEIIGFSFDITVIPEPSSSLLLALGSTAGIFSRRRQTKI